MAFRRCSWLLMAAAVIAAVGCGSEDKPEYTGPEVGLDGGQRTVPGPPDPRFETRALKRVRALSPRAALVSPVVTLPGLAVVIYRCSADRVSLAVLGHPPATTTRVRIRPGAADGTVVGGRGLVMNGFSKSPRQVARITQVTGGGYHRARVSLRMVGPTCLERRVMVRQDSNKKGQSVPYESPASG